MVALLNMPRAAWKRQPQGVVRLNPSLCTGSQCFAYTPIQSITQNGCSKSIQIVDTVQRYTESGGQYSQGLNLSAGVFLPGVNRVRSGNIVYLFVMIPTSTDAGSFAGCGNTGTPTLYVEQFQLNADASGSASAGNFRSVFRNNSGGVTKCTTASPILTVGKLITVAITLKSNSVIQYFVDGKEISLTFGTTSFTDSDTSLLDKQFAIHNFNYGSGSSRTALYGVDGGIAKVALMARLDIPYQYAKELSINPWQIFAPAPSRFYLIPSSGNVTHNLTSALTSLSSTSSPAALILRELQAALSSSSSTASITLNISSLISFLSAIASASSTASSSLLIQRSLLSALTSQSSTPSPALDIQRSLSTAINSLSSTNAVALDLASVLALVTALASASETSSPTIQVQRGLSSTISSTSETPAITLSIAGLIALLSAISSASSTATASASIQRALASALTSSSSTASITLNTTTLIALLSTVASSSLTATSALNIARSLSSVINSDSSTPSILLPIQRPFTTALTSQSSTSISALELINLIALMSGVSSQSSTATATANLARALVSSLLSASSTATISLPVLRELASTLVSISLNDAIDLALAVAGQVDLVSMIESGSLTNPQVRLLADLVAAIQTEMKLQMTGVSPSLKMTGSGPSIAVHRT